MRRQRGKWDILSRGNVIGGKVFFSAQVNKFEIVASLDDPIRKIGDLDGIGASCGAEGQIFCVDRRMAATVGVAGDCSNKTGGCQAQFEHSNGSKPPGLADE